MIPNLRSHAWRIGRSKDEYACVVLYMVGEKLA